MAENYVKIPEDTARRIGNAVVGYEKMMKSRGPQQEIAPRLSPYGFWAKITATLMEGSVRALSGSGAGRYSWIAQRVNSSGQLEDYSDGGTGTYSEQEGYAVERHNSVWVLKNDIVWLVPAMTYDMYIFDYHPGTLRGAITGTPSGDPADIIIGAGGTGEVTIAYPTEEKLSAVNTFNSQIKKSQGPGVQIAWNNSYHGRWEIIGQDCVGTA